MPDASPTRHPHIGLVRCGLAVLLLSLSVYGGMVGVGSIVRSIVFEDWSVTLGAGGYADYGTVAAHRLTLSGVLDWSEFYLPPTVGLVLSVILIRGRVPAWLRRSMRGAG